MQMYDLDRYEIGDVVEHKLNPQIFGYVLGFTGSAVHVRVAHTLSVIDFQDFELQRRVRVATGVDGDKDNVVDFAAARDTKKTKPEGEA